MQKGIGSGAPFGTVDELIPSHQEYRLRAAHGYLAAYFLGVPEHQIRILLNHPVVTFNPESILLREGSHCDDVHLILTGLVETIEPDSDRNAVLSAGAMVGESYALSGEGSLETFRALSFVRALRIPSALYRSFVARNEMTERIYRLADLRNFFNHTWLFGESLSNLTEVTIAEASEPFYLAAGEAIDTSGQDFVYMVRDGLLERIIEGDVVEYCGIGEPFNESEVLFGTQPVGCLVASLRTELLMVPGAVVRAIPVARWKLLELHQRRMRTFSSLTQDSAPC
jgi:hemerythrin